LVLAHGDVVVLWITDTAAGDAHVTPAFPPAFITVGNEDPLASQSLALAQALQRQGVRVETLFYPTSYTPPLGHEYRFDLSRPESREALNRTRAFLRSLLPIGA
jgi:acetyl esterase/lipase